MTELDGHVSHAMWTAFTSLTKFRGNRTNDGLLRLEHDSKQAGYVGSIGNAPVLYPGSACFELVLSILWFSSVPPTKYLVSNLNKAIPPSSPFLFHSVIYSRSGPQTSLCGTLKLPVRITFSSLYAHEANREQRCKGSATEMKQQK
jgi:hypothetical protein